MNYTDPQLRERLAAEYVLGTLRGRARDRFTGLLVADTQLMREVERWERQLNPMAFAAEPVEPPARVWRGIEQRLGRRPQRRRVGFWPWATGIATAAAVVLAVYIGVAPTRTVVRQPDFVATIGAESGASGPRWSIAANADKHRVSVHTLQPAQVASDKDLQLWLLPGDDAAPISLGLMPEKGAFAHSVSHAAVDAAPDAAGIAISREPKGGSPTGAPTGPVVYQGKLIRL